MTLSTFSVVLTAVCLAQLVTRCAAQVNPYQPETSGLKIVKAAVVEVNKALYDDKGILCRIAAVETVLGMHPDTYADPSWHGGIWNVTEEMYDTTKDTATYPGLDPRHVLIQNALGIDWMATTWEDLRKPVYSALAARLYLYTQNNVDNIPRAIADQATYWELYYHPGGDTDLFIESARSTVKGDPHVSQLVTGSKKPLCYDVFGKSGDIFNFLDEPEVAKVNAKLAARPGNNQKAIFVDTLAVFAGKISIFVDRRSVRINNDTYPWVERVETRTSNRETATVIIAEKETAIELSLLEIIVVKIGTHIDFGITHIGRIDPDATGILGDVARRARVIDIYNGEINKGDVLESNARKNNHAYLAVMGGGPRGSVKLLGKRPNCWKVPNDLQPFQAIIRENQIDCITC